MKTQKKAACISLTFMLGISLISCSEYKEEPADMDAADYASFQTVQKNMKTVEDFTFKVHSKGQEKGIGILADPMEYVATGGIEITSNNQIRMKMRVTEKVEPEITVMAYRENDNFYINNGGGLQLKLDMATTSPDSFEGFSRVWLINAQNLLNISKDMISSLELSQAEKNTVYSFRLRENDKTVDYVKRSMFGVEEDINDDGSSKDIDKIIPKVNVKIVAGEDNMVKSMSMDGILVVTYKIDPEREINYTYQLDMEYTSINTGLKIEFPDFSHYVVE